MVLSTHISSIAERILNEETLSIPDRSEVNMIEVRSLAKTNVIPTLKRVLESTNVTTKNITLNGRQKVWLFPTVSTTAVCPVAVMCLRIRAPNNKDAAAE